MEIINPYLSDKKVAIDLKYRVALNTVDTPFIDEGVEFDDICTHCSRVYSNKVLPIKSITLLQMGTEATYDVIQVNRKTEIDNSTEIEIWLGLWNDGIYNKVD